MAIGWKRDYLRYKDFFLNIVSIYNTKPNLKIYLELILSLTTIVLFSVFAIRPTVITILELNEEINSKQEIVLKLKQKLKNLQIANSVLQNETENLNYISEAVPKSADPDILIKQIEKLANNYSMQILGFTTSDIVIIGNKESENELPFTLSATGSYPDILAFLKSIEYLKRPVKIDSIAINSTQTENGKTLVIIITGKVPFL